ncbi:MAG TPA: hypothetical protein VHM25_00960 [Polyangiaceae bacterium]|nr:hypothetical protein [Polyangiaceae bacterium]
MTGARTGRHHSPAGPLRQITPRAKSSSVPTPASDATKANLAEAPTEAAGAPNGSTNRDLSGRANAGARTTSASLQTNVPWVARALSSHTMRPGPATG